jgi:ornithine carbamoyltransferase
MVIATNPVPETWAATSPADWPPHLLCAADLPCTALTATLDLASAMKRDSSAWRGALGGQTLACFFDPPTTGMTVATGTAADWLGMLPIVLPRDELGLDDDETTEDMARALSTTAAALFAHMVPHRVLRQIAAAATVPLVNGKSDQHRPCQAVADLLTLRERFGALEGVALAFVGDAHNETVHSLVEAGALAGMDVRICCPPDCRPDRLVELGARMIADMHDARLMVTDDVATGVRGANAVYTHAWSVTDGDGRRRLRSYQVGLDVMRLADPHAVFMHCLPAHRGMEVHARILDGRRSVVWEQAANRLPAEQALLYSLITAQQARDAR